MSATPFPDISNAWHTLNAEKTLLLLESDRQNGLSSEQVSKRLEHYGPNELRESEGRSTWAIFLDQFSNVMLIMLIGVAIVSGVLDLLALWQGGLSKGEIPFKDTIAIVLIVVLNGLLGFVQESRAEKALAALKKLASAKVRVIRDGRLLEIATEKLVPGDIMQIEAGVQVSADGRLVEVSNLQIRESALTGEAHAVMKQLDKPLSADTPLGDRVNLVFGGTEVVHGRATVVVTRTGMETELGRIATLLQNVETEPTPLQNRMGQLSNVLVIGSLTLVAIVVVSGLLIAGWKALQELIEVSLSMAVAVVPEGLPAVITVTLAIGTQRMVRRHALIRKLPAVETLGSVTTICSDKTGTLTQNKMVVQIIDTQSFSVQVTGEGYEPTGSFYDTQTEIDPLAQAELQPLLIGCVACNDATLQQDGRDWIILGDPTEGALLTLAGKGKIFKQDLIKVLPRVSEFPFSSERKRMSVILATEPSNQDPTIQDLPTTPYLMFTKGSPELILERCTQVQIDGQAETLTNNHQAKILERNNQLSSKGLRVLGFACRPFASLPTEGDEEGTEQELVWLGLVGMMDAPRPEAKEAVARCLAAGIRPMMITGDHQLTARAIAEQLGIAQADSPVLTGREIEKLTAAELEDQVERISVYARVAPEHKLRIVQALQHRKHIVAMTGDGVNDAPALKQADIGIAMGIAGTDVSKEASDMVLLDDNFATIVAATEEGRVVYGNIRRFIKYILGSNVGELLTIAAAPLFGIGGVPLTPLQILWMNLVTDGLPALALAVEPAQPNVMQRPPHDPSESIFSRGLGSYMLRVGIVFAIISIALMVWAYGYSRELPPERQDVWKTMVFTMLCLAQMGHAIAVRSSNRLIVEMNPFSNPYVPASVILTTVLQLMLVYVEPLRNFFGTQILTPYELWVCVGVGLLLTVWVELEKLVIRWYKHQQRSKQA